MPKTKKVKKSKQKNDTGAGTGYAGGKGDSKSISSGIKKAEQRQEVNNKQMYSFLIDFKNKLSYNLDANNGNNNGDNNNGVLRSFVFLQSFLTSNNQKQRTKIENTIKDVLLGHSPTEWDSKEKCKLINAALGVLDIVASDVQLSSALLGKEEDDNSLLMILRDITKQAKMIAAKSEIFESNNYHNNNNNHHHDNNSENNNNNNNCMDVDDINVATYFLQVQDKIERTMSHVLEFDLHNKKLPRDNCNSTRSGTTGSTTDNTSNDISNGTSNGTDNSTSIKESSSAKKENEYKQSMRKHRMDFVDKFSTHSFLSKPKYTGDSRRLYRELMSFQQALPIEYSTSIFVRGNDARIDLLRALIIGPDGTPYANGCFFFDIYLPPSYPQVAPKVTFLTTGCGTMRFNPNLYNCGKVCLSLLGTWQGPGWIPNESTLLQVLVSIQSLIFVNDPYYNEPGFEREQGTKVGDAKSKQYNSKIQKGTFNFGLNDHLKRLAGGSSFSASASASASTSTSVSISVASPVSSSLYPEFDNVLIKHFALKSDVIRQQINSWKKNISSGEQQILFAHYLSSVEKLCQQNENSESNEMHSRLGRTSQNDSFHPSSLSMNQSIVKAGRSNEKNKKAEVVLLDDVDENNDDDDDSHSNINTSNNKKRKAPTEIILLDDDDDDDVQITDCTSSKKTKMANIEVIEIE